MRPSASPLQAAFLEDHRHLTRGLAALLDAIRSHDLDGARRIADELDRVAGPHMEFEEAIYYPQIEPTVGRTNVDQLYREHRIGLRAIRFLMERDPKTPLSRQEHEELIEQLQTVLDHAVGCASLLSHLATLDEDRQAELLEELKKARARGRRWSELPREERGRSSTPG